jgi:hypothetical protein
VTPCAGSLRKATRNVAALLGGHRSEPSRIYEPPGGDADLTRRPSPNLHRVMLRRDVLPPTLSWMSESCSARGRTRSLD